MLQNARPAELRRRHRLALRRLVSLEIDDRRANRAARGIALIMVLWVVVLLTMIASEFAENQRTEVRIAANYKERALSYYYAMAGVNAGIAEFLSPRQYTFTDSKGDVVRTNKRPVAVEDAAPATPAREYRFTYGGFKYYIRSEMDKIGLNAITNGRNRADLDKFNRLLEASGVDIDTRPELINAVLDWRDDNDDISEPGGAETDWYLENYAEQGFPASYAARNDEFKSVEELLMVRGFSRQVVNGGSVSKEEIKRKGMALASRIQDDAVHYTGIAKWLTIHNPIGKVNLFSADPSLIGALIGPDPDRYQRAMEERAKGPFFGSNPDPNLFAEPNEYFRIVSTGFAGSGAPNHTIVAVFKNNPRDPRSETTILQWIDDAPLPPRYGGAKGGEAGDLDIYADD